MQCFTYYVNNYCRTSKRYLLILVHPDFFMQQVWVDMSWKVAVKILTFLMNLIQKYVPSWKIWYCTVTIFLKFNPCLLGVSSSNTSIDHSSSESCTEIILLHLPANIFFIISILSILIHNCTINITNFTNKTYQLNPAHQSPLLSSNPNMYKSKMEQLFPLIHPKILTPTVHFDAFKSNSPMQ